MKLNLVIRPLYIQRAIVEDQAPTRPAPLPSSRPVPSIAAALAIGGAMIAQPKPVQAASPRPSAVPLTMPALDKAAQARLHTATLSAMRLPGRFPLLLQESLEKRDGFKRVYALAIEGHERKAIGTAAGQLALLARELEGFGVRVGLYVMADRLKIIPSDCLAWQVYGKTRFLLYPRGGLATMEWAVAVYDRLTARTEIDEIGVTIEFPQE